MAKVKNFDNIDKIMESASGNALEINNKIIAKMVKIEEIVENEENFFSMEEDDRYKYLKESIQDVGILEPLIVVKDGDHYKLIAGHRRLKVAKECGYTEVPIQIKDLNLDNQRKALIDTNIPRELTPMAVAKIIDYYEKYFKSRKDVTGRIRNLIALNLKMSGPQVQRYKKLNDLIPEYHSYADSGKISLLAAESIAYLSPEKQKLFIEKLGMDKISKLTVDVVKGLREEINTPESEFLNFLEKHNQDSQKTEENENEQIVPEKNNSIDNKIIENGSSGDPNKNGNNLEKQIEKVANKVKTQKNDKSSKAPSNTKAIEKKILDGEVNKIDIISVTENTEKYVDILKGILQKNIGNTGIVDQEVKDKLKSLFEMVNDLESILNE